MTALAGMRVLVPRPSGRSSRLVGLLRTAGAAPEAVPMIVIEPAEPGPLDAALRRLAAGQHRWVGFTSVNAVSAVLDRAAVAGFAPGGGARTGSAVPDLPGEGISPSLAAATPPARQGPPSASAPLLPSTTLVAAVGTTTADALRAAGLPVHLVPDKAGSAETLAALWPPAEPGDRVLLPRSAIAPSTLVDALLAKGYQVEPVTAYRTRTVPISAAVATDLAAGRFGAVLLTSDSTVAALSGLRIAPSTAIGVIGPTTARAAAAAGLAVAFVSPAPTEAALAQALVKWAVGRPG